MSLKKDVIGAEVQIGSNEAQKSLSDLAQKTSSLANENDRLRISQAKLKALGKESSEEYKKVTAAIAENSKEIKGNQSQMDALRKTIGLSDMSMKQLKVQALNLRRELSSMNQSADPARWEQLNTQLVATERQMATVRGTIGTTSSFIGSLGTSLASIPGPVGAVIQSITGMGKALWVLVANPIGATIAVIVGGLMLLYKAFTSTDSGAVAMAGTFKVIGNVLDILIDRTMSFYKMLGSIVTLDWQGFKKNGYDAFVGLGKAITDTANAGWNYAEVMDAIDDREAAASNRMAKLRVDIEKLKNLSKDQTKTNKEKMDAAQLAIDKEIELNKIETGFITERNNAETMNLASKIQNGKLTMAQKEAQLKQWLAVDDSELESLAAKDAAFADFVNKNEKEFQAMQKSKADEIMKEAELAKETRRLESSLSGFKKDLIDEQVKKNEEAAQKATKALDTGHASEILRIKQYYSDKENLDKESKARILASDLAYLMAKSKLEPDETKKIELQSQIIEKQKEYNAALKEATPELILTRGEIDSLNTSLFEQVKLLGIAAKKQNEGSDATEELRIKTEKQRDMILSSADALGEALYDLASGGEDALRNAAKTMINFALDMLKVQVEIAMAKATIESLTQPDSVATFGATGLVRAAIMVGLIEAAFAGVKGLVNNAMGGSKQSGGFAETAASDSTPVGTYHANEFIGSAPSARNPSIRQVYNIIDLAQKQGRVATLNLPAVMASMGMLPNGRQNGGFESSQTNSGSPVIIPGASPDPALTDAINLNTQAIALLMKRGVSFPMVASLKKMKEVEDLLNQTGMGGFNK